MRRLGLISVEGPCGWREGTGTPTQEAPAYMDYSIVALCDHLRTTRRCLRYRSRERLGTLRLVSHAKFVDQRRFALDAHNYLYAISAMLLIEPAAQIAGLHATRCCVGLHSSTV